MKLNSGLYNAHSVSAANSSWHAIVCLRNKLHRPGDDKCVCEQLSRCQLTVSPFRSEAVVRLCALWCQCHCESLLLDIFMDFLCNFVLVLRYDSDCMSVALLRNIKTSLHTGCW